MTKEEFMETQIERLKYWMNLKSSTDELADVLSDYHKDTHGVRLRMAGESREAICTALAMLDLYHATMRETFEGREELRANGWQIEETDPMLAGLAKSLEAKREEQFKDNERIWNGNAH